jgi:hypothetical protein
VNFGELIDKIASELERDDLDSLIGDAILDAIRTYESTKFRFNTDVQQTTMTSGSGALSLPPGFFSLVSLKYRNSTDTVLEFKDYLALEQLDNDPNYTNPPEYYTIFNNQFRLYPVPDDDYETFVSYHRTYDLPEVDADTHNLIDNAALLIKCKAKAFLCANVLFDDALASTYQALADLEYKRHKDAYFEENESYQLGAN